MQASFLVAALLVAAAAAAPFLQEQEPPRAHRESTKAILDLEQQLKEQAGEDKQFYPSQMQPVLPSLTQADLMGSGEAEDIDDDAANELVKSMKPMVVDALADSNEDPEDMNHIKRPDVPALPVQQEEDNKSNEDQSKESSEVDNHSEEAPLSSEESHEEEEEQQEPVLNETESKEEEQSDSEEEPLEQHGSPSFSDEDEYEDYEEKLFLQSVMDTLREHPEMVEELLGEDNSVADTEEQLLRLKEYADQEHDQDQAMYDVPAEIDARDRDDEIKAEVMQATADELNNHVLQQQPLGLTPEEEARILASQPGVPVDAQESELEAISADPRLFREMQQMYRGDTSARVVSKKRGYAAPPASSEESAQSLEDESAEKEQLAGIDPSKYTMEELQQWKAYLDNLGSVESEEEDDGLGVKDVSSVAM